MDICGNIRFILKTVCFRWQHFYAVLIVEGFKNKIGCSSIFDSRTRIPRNCANFAGFEVVMVVLSFQFCGIWPSVDSYIDGFTQVYCFSLQCSPKSSMHAENLDSVIL
jgi:hypothetical protein